MVRRRRRSPSSIRCLLVISEEKWRMFCSSKGPMRQSIRSRRPATLSISSQTSSPKLWLSSVLSKPMLLAKSSSDLIQKASTKRCSILITSCGKIKRVLNRLATISSIRIIQTATILLATINRIISTKRTLIASAGKPSPKVNSWLNSFPRRLKSASKCSLNRTRQHLQRIQKKIKHSSKSSSHSRRCSWASNSW